LRVLIDQLRERVRGNAVQIRALEESLEVSDSQSHGVGRVGGWAGVAAGALAGAVLGGAGAEPAVAGNSAPILIERTTTASAGQAVATVIDFSKSGGGQVKITDAPPGTPEFPWEGMSLLSVRNTVGPDVRAIQVTTTLQVGVVVNMNCYRPVNFSAGVFADLHDGSSGAGVLGSNSNRGNPQYLADPANTAVGVRGYATGVYGIGVLASGVQGVVSEGSGAGYAVFAAGNARLGFQRATTRGAPLTGTYSLASVVGDTDGNLFANVASGSPGTFRKIVGPATAGAYHAISPVRVFDSRAPQPNPGALSPGEHRTVSVADGRDLVSGVVTAAGVVPVGATAVTCNVTVVNTESPGGFLAVNPGGDTVVAASTINWFGAGQILANAITSALGGDRQLTMIAGSAGTDFILDVSGYYL